MNSENKSRAELIEVIEMEIASHNNEKYIVIKNKLFNTPLGDAIVGDRYLTPAYTVEQAEDLIKNLIKGLNYIDGGNRSLNSK